MAEQVKDKTIYIDPQTNQVYTDVVKQIFNKCSRQQDLRPKYFRTDNLKFNNLIDLCCRNI